MGKLKIVHTIYSGLGGHGSILFPLLEKSFGEIFENHVVFYGVEELSKDYKRRIEEAKVPYTVIQKKSKEFIRPLKKFRLLLESIEPDKIFVHNSELIVPAIRWGNKNACDCFYVEHENNQSKSRLLQFLTKYALKRAKNVICLSSIFKNELEERYGISKKIKVIANGVDILKFKPNLNKSRQIIGMAGRFVVVKDQQNLIRTFAKLRVDFPNLELYFAGSGVLLNECKQLGKSLNCEEQIKFLGTLSEDEMTQFYSSLQIYVHATHAENMSTSILQAMACGTPIITSDIANNKALIQDGSTGVLYTVNNVDSLYEKIKFGLENSDKLEQFAKNAHRLVTEEYSIDQMVLNYLELVQSAD